MIVLITGASHTGKTVLAQKLLEKYRFPYLSIDHLKMGLIRSGNTGLTPEDDAGLEKYLWPIVREIIKTAVENRQNLIIEGCYIPFDWKKDFNDGYLAHIRYYCLVMSRDYILNNFALIKRHASEIECRRDDSFCTEELLLADNRRFREQCEKNGFRPVVIDGAYSPDVDLNVVTESGRLVFTLMSGRDFPHVASMLKDPEVMYAWEKTFTDGEVREWISLREANYLRYGYDYFLAVKKDTGDVVGQAGLLAENIGGKTVCGLGYILNRKFMKQGYGTECARAMMDYAFRYLGKDEVFAAIRPENTASRKVAERLGMSAAGSFVKTYNGKDMPHLIYRKSRDGA